MYEHTALALVDGTLDLTQSGLLAGTPAYMAPEQFACKATDGRTDQFAFCIVLCEAIYHARPFAGATIEELHQATLAGALLPEKADVDPPPDLRSIIERGLSVAPEDRFPTMASLIEVLEDLARDERASALRC